MANKGYRYGGRKNGYNADTNAYIQVLATRFPNTTMNFKQEDTMLMSYLIYSATFDWRLNRTKWEDDPPEAWECALLLCTQVIKSEARNGYLTETVVASQSRRKPDSYQPYSTLFKYKPEKIAPMMAAAGNTLYEWLDIMHEPYPYPIIRTDLQIDVPEGSSDPPLNITQSDIYGTVDFLRIFAGQNRTWWPKNNELTGQASAPGIAEALSSSHNFSATFEQGARSITNQIRDSGRSPVRGTSYQWKQHVKVRWAFLSFPAAIVVAGCFYVALAITESVRMDVPPWKESALPSLLHGFDEETQTILRSGQGDRKAESVTAKTYIKFDGRRGRLRVVA